MPPTWWFAGCYWPRTVEALVGTQGAVYIFLLYVTQSVIIVLAGVIPLYAMNLGLGDLLGTKQLKEGLSQPPPAMGDEAR